MEHTRLRMRMAPAPSGFLHLGNVRTFLFDYLYDRAHDGELVLRIEDTDAERSSPEAESYIEDCLHWLGIRWEEGPDVGGPVGPYRQSERTESHRAAGLSLLATGHAYECFCSLEDLEAERRAQEARGEAPRYGGRCRNLTDTDRESRRGEGRVPSIRFRVPEGKRVGWDDMVYGHIEFLSDDIGDFVILRSNGSPIYNLANVADDHDMAITVALRSQSHISNTPRQIMLYEALGWPSPRFAHVPDVLDNQGRKMGKRYGAKGVTEYRDEGYLPAALVNYMALLGWSPPSGEEFLSMDELCHQFSFDRVQRSNAAFDATRLEWFNAQWIRRLSIEDLFVAALPFLAAEGMVAENPTPSQRDMLLRILVEVQPRVRTLAEIPPMVAFLFRESVSLVRDDFAVLRKSCVEMAEALTKTRRAAEELREWSSEGLVNAVSEVASNLEWKRGDLFMAVRIAVTGKTVSPPLTQSMEILGKPTSLNRMQEAINILSENSV